MGKKLIITSLSLKIILLVVLGSAIYTFFYPWLYNQVNHYTNRSQDLPDIDYVNSLIMFSIINIISCMIVLFLFQVLKNQ
jgi:hypothetical protein